MADNVVKYGSKSFGEIKEDLISLIKQTYPEVLSDFTDSSVGSMLIDLNAGVGNVLTMNTERVFQETQIENARLRSSVLNIAKNMGFNIPPKRPSVTVVDFTVTVPVLGDKPDSRYYPILDSGAQVLGGDKIFETQGKIDWGSPRSNLGDTNRAIVPNLNSNGIIASYNVTKREVVFNGSTNIYKKVITVNDVIPFFSITLPDADIIEIQSVVLIEGSNIASNPDNDDFMDHERRYYEVDYLAQQKLFVEDSQSSRDNMTTGNIKAGKWIDITKKFIKEFTPNGYCKLTFGSGDSGVDSFKSGFLKHGVTNKHFLDNFLNNTALGEKLKEGYTLFVKYRTGGGSSSNIGSNTLTNLGNHNLIVKGLRNDYIREVQRSLTVTNPIPAIGGNDGLSVEQIRYLTKYNFSSQNRDVVLTDYLVQVYKMPGKFGSPYRANAFKLDNKIVIPILGIGVDGKLSNTSTTLLKENIAEYLSGFRMVNDYIEIRDGKIINLGIELDIYVENVSDNQVANSVINKIMEYFNIHSHKMNEDIFLGRLEREILNVSGVINILNIKIFNKVGGQYSNNITSEAIRDTSTGELKLVNNTIHSTQDSMFEIKYPERDIVVLLRKKVK